MNVIKIPLEHKMFEEEVIGELPNFIFNNFSILFTRQDNIVFGATVFFEVNDIGDISETQIHLVRLGEQWIKDVYYEIRTDYTTKKGFDVYCNSFDKRYVDIGYEVSVLVMRSMIYIMNTPRNRILKGKAESNRNFKNNEKKTDNAKQNKIYLLDEIVDYVNENGLMINPNSKRKINCDCWGVRGHYRHYKSGKVVFIKEYKKGKNRENKEPKGKEYIL